MATSIVNSTLKTENLTFATEKEIEATKKSIKTNLEAMGFYADEEFI
uniref:Uncharacterized protein n=1 Tax=Siphoviridae sp. ctWhx86 TaxID=2826362 RepID=A0A8S5QP40_9CAUD|nr:MAG TPA: hypothetical protein [Siphoviridae sp. ctWhx86]